MLRLGIENAASLASGDPVEITLAEHGLVIGRAAHADWTLPDPHNHISSLHCEIDYRDGRYFLTDRSTNGTFINGARDRPAGPVQLRDGDLVAIGHYQVRVEELGADAQAGGGAGGAFGGGIDWGVGSEAAARPASATHFGRAAPRPLFQSGDDPLMRAFAPPRAAPPPAADPFGIAGAAPAADPFGIAAAPPPADPFGTAGTPARSDPFGVVPPAPMPGDPFGVSAASHPPADPFGMAAVPAPPPPLPPPHSLSPHSLSEGTEDPWAMLNGAGAVDFGAMPAPVPGRVPTSETGPISGTGPVAVGAGTDTGAGSDALFERLLAATGLDRRDLGTRTPGTVADAIGQLLRQTADGLFRLLEARTRVRHRFGVGAQVTTFQRAGNNPLKWTRSPEHALKQMIGDPDPGFMEGTQAVRAAFEDLQAHEMAMMAAMQEAMQETIRRFAPDAIRARIGARGWLTSVLPGSREATLWRAYESEFGAFADESEAAYLDVFARQFKKAYERIAAEAGRKD